MAFARLDGSKPNPATVLDVGCGIGGTSRFIAKVSPPSSRTDHSLLGYPVTTDMPPAVVSVGTEADKDCACLVFRGTETWPGYPGLGYHAVVGTGQEVRNGT